MAINNVQSQVIDPAYQAALEAELKRLRDELDALKNEVRNK